MKNKNGNINEYYARMHRIGKIMILISITVFVAIPIITCLRFDVMPSWKQILVSSAGLMAIFIPTSISEIISDTPIMGTSYYLSAVTGNIMNMKLPAAINALHTADVEQGTEEADAVVGVAVAISSITTMIIIAVGVLLLTPLRPILTTPAVQTASSYILPALFGSLILGILGNNVGGGVVITGRLKAAILPAIVLLVVYRLIPIIYSQFQGFLILFTIPIMYIITKKMYKSGKIKVHLPEDNEEIVEQKAEE